MEAAQANELREGAKVYPLRKMFLDVAGDAPLLPHSEPAADLRLDARRPGVETCKLMHEHEAECLKIELIS
jgi:hypothetical protein